MDKKTIKYVTKIVRGEKIFKNKMEVVMSKHLIDYFNCPKDYQIMIKLPFMDNIDFLDKIFAFIIKGLKMGYGISKIQVYFRIMLINHEPSDIIMEIVNHDAFNFNYIYNKKCIYDYLIEYKNKKCLYYIVQSPKFVPIFYDITANDVHAVKKICVFSILSKQKSTYCFMTIKKMFQMGFMPLTLEGKLKYIYDELFSEHEISIKYTKQKCCVCEEECMGNISQLSNNCKCYTCFDCINEWLQYVSRELQTNFLEFKPISPCCGEILSNKIVNLCDMFTTVDKNALNKLSHSVAYYRCYKHPLLVHCPIDDCHGYAFIPEEEQMYLECFACKKEVLFSGKKFQKVMSDEDKAKLIELDDTRECPNCKNLVVKNGGCSQMKCLYCHAMFDWNSK